MDDFINKETLKYAKKILVINVNNTKYMVYTIPNYDNYGLYASKMIKFNNIVNLIEIDNEEKNYLIDIIKTIIKLNDAEVLSKYLTLNKINLE